MSTAATRSMAHRINHEFLENLSNSTAESRRYRPNYWDSDPASLLTKANISTVALGTGSSIYTSLGPIIEATEHELILVTCFWARSTSLQTLSASLVRLSQKGTSQRRKIRVRICLSSVGVLQKLFHTQSLSGYVYPPERLTKDLGLPGPAELSGLDLQVKSIFVKPFSVMHPKFIVVDRRTVSLPSCNISWEDWFEGCIMLSGDVVDQFVRFWSSFWRSTEDTWDLANAQARVPQNECILPEAHADPMQLPTFISLKATDVPCVFLPSPHNVNPKFRFPWQASARPPSTPLNSFLLAAFRRVEHDVYIQTPNLTSPPVLQAIVRALRRGVNIHIITCEQMMILEQLVTAGRTTPRCVKSLIRQYQSIPSRTSQSLDAVAEEGRMLTQGHLTVEYYQPNASAESNGHWNEARASWKDACAEPVQSHLKLSIFDNELVVLGSGNLDRASWYTSQELGVALHSEDLAQRLSITLEQVMTRRKRLVFDSKYAS